MADRERPSEDRVGALIESSLRVAIPIRNKLADLMLVHLWHVCPNCEQPLVSGARFCNGCGSGIGAFGVTSPKNRKEAHTPSGVGGIAVSLSSIEDKPP